MTDKMSNNIKRAGVALIMLFAVLTAYLVKLAVFDASSIVTSPYNLRLRNTDTSVIRGSIFDKNGNIIAETQEENDGLKRVYSNPESLSHIVGYTGSHGSSGIEASMNFELEKVDGEIIQRAKSLMSGDRVQGNSVYLTIDSDLSAYIYSLLKKYNGAVIVLEPSTGKILASVSSPAFDSSTVDKNWSALRQNEAAPLLNRATNGLYTPASTFKIITALAALNSLGDEALTFTYKCNGRTLSDGVQCGCYDYKAHGELDFKKAFAVSCNAYFAELARMLPENALKEAAESLLYNKAIGYKGDYRLSSFPDYTQDELILTATGQGKALATSLHQALIAAAIANDGVVMEPYIVDSITGAASNVVKKYLPKASEKRIDNTYLEFIRECMLECVTSGTGKQAAVSGAIVAGKTGTADMVGTKDNSWFVGFAPYDSPEYAISVVLEASGSGKATELAGKVLDYLLK